MPAIRQKDSLQKRENKKFVIFSQNYFLAQAAWRFQ